VISSGFEAAYKAPTDSELLSWQLSIPELVSALHATKFDQLQVILELAMPIGLARADVVLLGGSPNKPVALVIELKQWSHISIIPDTYEVEVPGIDIHQHPSLQALNYAGKLHFFNARAHNYEIHASAFLHNATRTEKVKLTFGPAKEWSQGAPIFTQQDYVSLADYVSSLLLPCNIKTDEHIELSQSRYDQSQHLFTFLQEHAEDIARSTEIAIANRGMGLTTQQDRLKNEVFISLSFRQEN